jgi:hypothetical protein
MQVYGQASPSTSLSTDQTSEGWMTSFDLEDAISLPQERIAISY